VPTPNPICNHVLTQHWIFGVNAILTSLLFVTGMWFNHKRLRWAERLYGVRLAVKSNTAIMGS